jgi:SAM-dependent methyltransferase
MSAGCRNQLCIGVDSSFSLLRSGIDHIDDIAYLPVCGRGERLPLKPNSCDLVTVAQGFHWMHRHDSLTEIQRVLKPGAGLGLIWYRRKDLTSPHQAYIEELTRHYNPNYDPKFMDADYVGMLTDDGRFDDIGERVFYDSKSFDLDTYIRWQRSKSFIGDALEPDLLDEFLQKVRAKLPAFFPNGVIVEEFKYDLVWGRKK